MHKDANEQISPRRDIFPLLLPTIPGTRHPIHSDQLQVVLGGKLSGTERPSLHELLSADISLGQSQVRRLPV